MKKVVRLKFTKETMKREIKVLTKAMLLQGYANDLNKIYASNLEGRYYIHSKATIGQLESLYEDLVNFVSDNRIIIG